MKVTEISHLGLEITQLASNNYPFPFEGLYMRYLIRQRRDKLVDMLSFRYLHSCRIHKKDKGGDDGGSDGGKETGILLGGGATCGLGE